MSEIFLCSICNVKSGNCNEDCAYCTQSKHYNTNINSYDYKSIEQIVNEAKLASKAGALGFCLVTSGRGFSGDGIDGVKINFIARAASEIKASGLHLHLIACNGRASFKQLAFLKENGIDSYNHNLETAKSYFPKICSTHTYEERYETNQNAINAGLGICCGGIFGLGESNEQRIELLEALKTLNPHTSTINFYIKNDALPIKTKQIDKEEAIAIIKKAKELLPNTRLMAAGGRELVFKDDFKSMFLAGINSIVLGDYLTTKGNDKTSDIELIQQAGYKIATSC
ncbi:biotin synthase [Campylobacter canadensis]|uniref:Biotin synthase n=1 Tax=Campylobacter canadensis TaxID=449520 RepID=A0ABS7WP99_9BACT|nr:biotin synthase [Campylobacter canadensis]MBZ7986590.1 biotin synthase [Campylobacter canadensis]MBZ7995992.1 biotin synthase [Campylobacter canadensis]MBZ7997626.1 biotin synthase [Campylobacter canadensis]MBZ7999336.1 biotin synthase [Campylobacter canadensis]MBZ8001133.1 biotin synthase [Campylobacter canadensis]